MKDIVIKNATTVNLRVFHVNGTDKRTGETAFLTVTVSKEQLQAAQIVGQSSKELIERLCEKQGYDVWEIGKPDKLTVTVELDKLWDSTAGEEPEV